MKTTTRILTTFAISLFAVTTTTAQCEPDTANCKDVENPGEFCPNNLEDATVNVMYDQVITVIPPSTYDFGESTLDIIYIEIDSVKNLPPGIDYYPNADTFFADTAYCIQISGIPTSEGEYPLYLYVTPTINHPLTGIIEGPQVVDTTSVVMTVLGPSGIDPYQIQEFRVLQNIPNPFSDVTRLGFFTPFDDRVELKVYNILGEMMHHEKQGAPPGDNYFSFDGSALLPGTYFYRVTNSSAYYTGKFIKTE